MSENWAIRERHTHELVGALTDYVLERGPITASQLHGLCALTWLTKGHHREHAPYIESTKLPAIADILGDEVSIQSLADTARTVAATLGKPELDGWVRRHTGFTMFYAAYRKSSYLWLRDHRTEVIRIVRAARAIKSDTDAEEVAGMIETLPRIPKANHPQLGMRPEYLLTPLVFSLDPRLRFPIVNGRAGVRKLLTKLGVRRASLPLQVRTMMGLIGKPGVADAADIDSACHGDYLHELVGGGEEGASVSRLTQKATEGEELPLKDAEDVVAIASGLEQVKRRLHNKMTNRLKALFADWTIIEGLQQRARFDALLRDFNEDGDDLLIEVKSSSEDAHVRMAIGQLYAYAHHLRPGEDFYMAVVLPERPAGHVLSLLEELDIGCMWFDGPALASLQTETAYLEHLSMG